MSRCSYWSNQVNCQYCGFTNKYFLRKKYFYKGKEYFTFTKVCVDCCREKEKERQKNLRKTEKYKIWYRSWCLKNKDRIKRLAPAKHRKHRIKKRLAKQLEKRKQEMIWRDLK